MNAASTGKPFLQIRNCSALLIRKRKCHQGIGHFLSKISAASRCSHNELLAGLLAHVSYRSGVRTCFKGSNPKLLSGLCIESPETPVYRRPNEYHPAGRHNRAAKVRRSSRRLQFIYDAKWDLPGDLSLIHVHGVERSPRRLLAWPLVLVPEPRVFAIFGRSPVLLRCVSGLRFHLSNGSQLICIDKQIPGSTIKRSPRPVPAPQCAGYHQCHLAAVRCIHSVALKRMKQLSAISIGFRCHRADVRFAERLPDERWRFDWERLRRPGGFAGHVALGNCALLHRKQRFSSEPVEDKYKSR